MTKNKGPGPGFRRTLRQLAKKHGHDLRPIMEDLGGTETWSAMCKRCNRILTIKKDPKPGVIWGTERDEHFWRPCEQAPDVPQPYM